MYPFSLFLSRLLGLAVTGLFLTSAGFAIDDPVSPNAIPESKSVLLYLESISGHQILSGQQQNTSVPIWNAFTDDDDVNFIQQNTGKLPVVRGLDFIWYTYSADIAATQTLSAEVTAWVQKGGLAQLCCHWFTDIGSPPGKQAFYTQSGNAADFTTFDINQVIIDGTPENIEFLSKLARIAPELQKLRDRHIPVIWRPFHEAGGAWFWWSAKGAEPFKKAWRWLYARMTIDYGLTNLIWCFNPNGDQGLIEAWYPGDDVVDIISCDFYPSSGHPTSAAVYTHFRAFSSNKKVVTMSENGAIPDPDLLFTDGSGWASFCTWNGFISNPMANALDFVKKVYASPKVITLDEVGDIYHFAAGFPAEKPIVTTTPASGTAITGGTITLSISVPAAASFQWYKNGAAVPGAINSILTLTNAQISDAGAYTCVASNGIAATTSTSSAVYVYSADQLSSARISNISTRSFVGTDANVQIAGFIISGSAPKTVLIRASGPALNDFGVTGFLADPIIELHDDKTTLATNDNWDADATNRDAVENARQKVNAFAWKTGSKDAALVATLPPGGYTAIVSGANHTSGVALVEVYELDQSSPSRLSNISTRSVVQTDAAVQIAGFIVSGTAPKKVLIRASGPALNDFGVQGALADPSLELHDATTTIATNDNWDADDVNRTAVETARASVNAFAWKAGSKDAALVATLQPGLYTAIVSGVNRTTGVALVEVYELP